MYKNILVAIDGSPTSDFALREALKFGKIGCKIIAVSVIDNPLVNYEYGTPYTTATFDYDQIHAGFCQQAETILTNAKNEARRTDDVSIETYICQMISADSPLIASIEAPYYGDNTDTAHTNLESDTCSC